MKKITCTIIYFKFKFYEEDGSSLIIFYPLNARVTDERVCARGVADLGHNLVSIGTSSGRILIFEIPPKGNKISVISEISDSSIESGITALTVDNQRQFLCAGDSMGNCVVFNIENIRNIKTSLAFKESKLYV